MTLGSAPFPSNKMLSLFPIAQMMELMPYIICPAALVGTWTGICKRYCRGGRYHVVSYTSLSIIPKRLIVGRDKILNSRQPIGNKEPVIKDIDEDDIIGKRLWSDGRIEYYVPQHILNKFDMGCFLIIDEMQSIQTIMSSP